MKKESGGEGGRTALARPPEIIKKLADYLDRREVKAYVVGGWLRDALLGRPTADIDVAVAGDALEVASETAAALGGRYVLLDSEHGVARVVLPGAELDFSTLRGDIESDLAARDFTLNAMAIELDRLPAGKVAAHIIDPLGGEADIRGGIIRAVADGAFAADPARLLRAARLTAELGFELDEHTVALVKRDARLVTSVAGERVREELLRLLALPKSGSHLARLDELGLLTAIFPELEAAKGTAQPKEHFWDVFTHSLRTVTAVDFLLDEGEWEFGGRPVLESLPPPSFPTGYFAEKTGHGSTRKSLLRLAALLHDVSKPAAKTVEASGRMRFLGHAGDGAAVAAARLEKLRFSAAEIKLVEAEVLHHLRPTQLSHGNLPTDRAIYRYFRDTGEAALDILLLSLADHLAARGPGLDPAAWKEHLEATAYIISRQEQKNIASPPILVNGYDIIKILGGYQGPLVGEILETVREAQADGEVATKQEALDFIERLLSTSEYTEKIASIKERAPGQD